jgi:alanyl-tRNA synthetase
MKTANEIRQQFIDFFCKKHGHTFVPSSSVVPLDDPTLLFTNAGMNQFKPYFLGTEKPPYPRAANTQKCIRAGGKHNDLDDVGKDTYHHTFFEMLGNWSFGDYFKKEAIAWAWELLTSKDWWKIDPRRLHVTVFEGDEEAKIPRDDEAANFWRAVGVPDDHIHLGNKKDNFWEMGDTGPCGPCTEIHYDNTPDLSGGKLVNKGTPDVIEIWNLVFIQFNRNPDKSLTPLPAKHVDTGMGFERVTKVLQGKTSNYDTDVFTPIFAAIQKVTGAPAYTGKLDDLKDTAYRVIGDHIRTLTFALSDGGTPGPDDRGYVLRNILRRAERFGWQHLGTTKPFLGELVETVCDVMGSAFPELLRDPRRIRTLIIEEERLFLQTLAKSSSFLYQQMWSLVGHAIAEKNGWTFDRTSIRSLGAPIPGSNSAWSAEFAFNDSVGSAKSKKLPKSPSEIRQFVENECATVVLPGNIAFWLHDEQGLDIEITEQIAKEVGINVDRDTFRRVMDEKKARDRGGRKKHVITAIEGDLPKTDDSPKFSPLAPRPSPLIQAWVKGNLVGTGSLQAGDQVGLVLDKTNFYAEQGGQVGDAGWIKTDTGSFEVEDTQRLGDSVIHWGKVFEGAIKTGQKATLEVAPARLDTMRNHTATHLMNWALRQVLGDHVEQKGSLVDAEKTRFDFTHDKPMTADEITEVERLVNEKILADQPVSAVTMPLSAAKQIAGVRAVFGEKYPDPVRVISIGNDPESMRRSSTPITDMSVEFCGGTHLSRTSQACLFKIVGQEGVAKGVRRITAVTGPKAIEYDRQLASVVGELTERFRCRPEELPTRIESLQEEIKKLQQQLKKGATTDLAGVFDKLLASATKTGEVSVLIGEIPAGPDDAIRMQVDRIKQKAGSAVVVVGWVDEGKVGLLAAVSDDVIKKGVKAGDLIKQIAPIVGGGGGGRPNMAQAGGKEPAKLAEALERARKIVGEQLAK